VAVSAVECEGTLRCVHVIIGSKIQYSSVV
jgi:hypothetical protein